MSRGLSHVPYVPEVGILAALARQVGPDAARPPQERMVVDELARLGVLAVAVGLVAKGPDHLRVAVEAPFADVEVPSRQLERRVRLDRRDGRHVRLDQEGRDDLEERRDDDRERRQHGERQRQPLPRAVPRRLGEPRQCAGGAGRGELLVVAGEGRRLDHRLLVGGRARLPGAEEVVAEEDHAGQVERPAHHAHPVHRHEAHDGLDERRVLEAAGLVEGAPHQALREAGRCRWRST